MIVMSNFYHWGIPVVDVLKTIPYRDLPKSGNVVLLRSCCVCGVVVYPILELLCV
jgi:hypothetical protein